jgi:hypothetical protein
MVHHGSQGARGPCPHEEDPAGENCRSDDCSDVSFIEYHDTDSYSV